MEPVKAEVCTRELDEEPSGGSARTQVPPPYHIAAARSKQAGSFTALHTGQRQGRAQEEEDRRRRGEEEERRRRGEVEEHYYENQDSMKQRRAGGPGAVQGGLERRGSFLSDGTFESISESEASTAPSSLQTIVRAPYSLAMGQYGHLAEEHSDLDSQVIMKPG